MHRFRVGSSIAYSTVTLLPLSFIILTGINKTKLSRIQAEFPGLAVREEELRGGSPFELVAWPVVELWGTRRLGETFD